MALQLQKTSVGIAKLLRSMDSPELGDVFAGAAALQRFLAAKGKTFGDFASCVEAWTAYEAALMEHVEAVDASGGLYEQALMAQNEADNSSCDGDWVNPAHNTEENDSTTCE
jgi:hypothetical protein